jgi:hypothetical protein
VVDCVIRTVDREHCVATWDRVLIQVWNFAALPAAIRDLQAVARRFISEHSAAISSVSVVERTSPPPNDEARALLAGFYRELGPQMSAQIVVAEGGGFRQAIVRAVGVTLSALAPRALPFRFASSLMEASVLVAPHLSPGAGGETALLQALQAARAQSRHVEARA